MLQHAACVSTSPLDPRPQSLQLFLTLSDPRYCSPPGSPAHGILQARIPEWIVVSFSRGTARLRDRSQVSCVSCLVGGFFTAEPLGKAQMVYYCFRPDYRCPWSLILWETWMSQQLHGLRSETVSHGRNKARETSWEILMLCISWTHHPWAMTAYLAWNVINNINGRSKACIQYSGQYARVTISEIFKLSPFLLWFTLEILQLLISVLPLKI